jgi:hypothetical protein
VRVLFWLALRVIEVYLGGSNWLGRKTPMLKPLIFAGMFVLAFTGIATATPIPATPKMVASDISVIRVKLDHGPNRSGRSRRPYAIVLSLGLLAGLIAAAVRAD